MCLTNDHKEMLYRGKTCLMINVYLNSAIPTLLLQNERKSHEVFNNIIQGISELFVTLTLSVGNLDISNHPL